MESLKKKKDRVKHIFEILDPLYTYEKTALDYRTPIELLIATILSAQCTDRQVNEVTKSLFKKYRKAEDYVQAPISELEMDIRPTGFYKNKAKSLKGCCRALLDLYGGVVPATMEELLKLPGVGRKTANCVLGAVFNVPGVVVDTHVKRLALRLGLTNQDQPDKIELDLQQLLPPEQWRRFSDILIYHGRAICKARNPDHTRCPIFNLCPSHTLTVIQSSNSAARKV
ncbi:MAG: endonuclease III [Deltaproteobacteria bacterium]|nr:endonuclease III [Deltaproteobacteria bacterium]